MHTEPIRPAPHQPPFAPQYEPPQGAPAQPRDPADTPAPLAAPRPLRHGRVFALAAGPLLVAVAVVAMQLSGVGSQDAEELTILLGLLLGAAAVIGALANVVRTLARAPGRSLGATLASLGVSLLSGLAALLSMGVSSAMVVGSGRGRQLRRLGRPLHAAVHEGSPWLTRVTMVAEPQADLGQVADAWRTNGQTEHASVAAFAELSLELVALGAPPRLIAAAHQDALDEMRHTEQCFSLAQALDGRPRGPRDFAAASRMLPRLGPRALRLAHLAVTSLYDGALYEGLSARVVAELARTAVDPRVRPVLEAIARDEARHAAHGFEIVRWCLDEGGAPVARALAVAIDRVRDAQPHALIPDARAADGRWEHFGIPGRARELAGWDRVRAQVVARTERLLGRGGVTVA